MQPTDPPEMPPPPVSEGNLVAPADPAVPGTAAAPATPAEQRKRGHERTRTSAAFSGLIAGAIVLILLLVFILENTKRVDVSYFGATGRISLGVALLLAAVAGALLVGLVGTARVLQLRRRIKHPRR